MSGIVGTSHSRSKIVGKSQDTAKAWAQYDMTGTPAIKDSFGFSTITDQATGTARLNFTSAMLDTNYSAVASGDAASTWTGAGTHASVMNTAYVQVYHVENGSAFDTAVQSVIVFGD